MQFLVSAGEASGDLYAAGTVSRLRELHAEAGFYGCAGPRLQGAGVNPVIRSEDIAVVGLAEIVVHLPRIYRNFKKLVRFARQNRPDAALVTDSPDFHLRLARELKRLDVPVFYLVAPQVWAWRPRRVRAIRDLVKKLLCIFPFEEAWFRERGVDATYIGHPLASIARLEQSRDNFFRRHNLAPDSRLIVLLPGSRLGEARRHLPILIETIALLRRRLAFSAILAIPGRFHSDEGLQRFRERLNALSIQVVENETWDSIGHADLALAASGTVTIECALLGTPMVTFYKVNPLSWYAGRRLVKVPFLSMVNLIADRQIVPELIQHDMSALRMAQEAEELLTNFQRADRMRADLATVRKLLTLEGDPFARAALLIAKSCGISSDFRSCQSMQETIS